MRDYMIVLMLMCTAVPAGFLPLATVALISDEVRAMRNPPRGRHPNAAIANWVGGAIAAAMSALMIWVFRRQLRQSRDPQRTFAGGELGGGAWRAILWSAFVLGIGCGVGMLIVVHGT